MPLPLIPIAIVSLAGVAYGAQRVRDASAVPSATVVAERAMIFDTAMNTCKDSDKLRALAASFKQVKMNAEATMLCKRAALIDAPPELKASRKDTLERALASKNKGPILNVANAFEEIGAMNAASKLRAHAATLPDESNPGIGPTAQGAS